MAPTWHEARLARERDDLAARKKKQDENRDQELEACVVAYGAHRVNGGQQRWEEFRREWYMTRGAKDGR